MKKTALLIIALAVNIFLFEGCSAFKKNKEMHVVKITETTIESDFAAQPDKSINIKQLKDHFEKYPERWETVFRFLIETDLPNLEIGRTDFDEKVYAVVSEYQTKELLDAKYESHKKYIDLQYVISGKEYIGVTRRNDLEVVSPYDETKDIAFYNFGGGDILLASPSNYFIFFPEDIHRPCIEVNEPGMVRKIVFKIQLN